jgi:hypothetical protein
VRRESMRTVHVRLTAGQTRALDELRLYLGRRWERGGPVTASKAVRWALRVALGRMKKER